VKDDREGAEPASTNGGIGRTGTVVRPSSSPAAEAALHPTTPDECNIDARSADETAALLSLPAILDMN
jgi:hypothetical protein